MGRNIEIDARRGGGAAHEILFGEVTIEATALRQDGTKTVFPAPTTIGISNGVAVLENVDVSPAGPEPAWAYRMTFRDHMSGRGWSEMVGVPTGTTAVKYPTLPRFTTAIPPETTKADLQNWVATTEAAKNTAVQAAATATAPTDAMVADKINDPASLTGSALSAAIDVHGGSPGLLDQMAAAAFPPQSPESVTITSASISGTTFAYDTDRVRRIGCRPVVYTQNGATYIQSQGKGQSGSGATPWAVEFLTDATVLTLEYRAAINAPEIWAWVDGRPVTVRPSKMSATAGFKARFTLTFGYSKSRRIRLWMKLADFGGLIVPASATITAPASREILRCAWQGDSWFDGAGNVGWPDTVPYLTGALLGWESMPAGIGGTGYVQSATPYGQQARRDAVVAYAPHIVVVFGSINDRTKTYAEIYAAAVALYADYATRLPSSKIIVIGPQLPLTGTDVVRDALAAAVAASSNCLGFIDILDLISGSGSISEPDGNGNADMYLQADKAHPTRMGSSFVARRIVEKIVTLMERAGLPFDAWTGASIPDVNQPDLAPLTDIITTNLLVEVDASSLALTDGASVASITPSRGSKLNQLASSGGDPTFIASGTHGRKAIKITGAQSLISAAWTTPTVAGAPLTFYSVHRMVTTGTGSQNLYRFGAASPSPGYLHVSAGGGYSATAAATVNLPNMTLNAAGGWRVDAMIISGGQVKHWENSEGMAGQTALSSSATAAVLTRLGSIGGGTTGYEAHISYVLAYEGEHTPGQVAQMMEFLAAEWGVTLR